MNDFEIGYGFKISNIGPLYIAKFMKNHLEILEEILKEDTKNNKLINKVENFVKNLRKTELNSAVDTWSDKNIHFIFNCFNDVGIYSSIQLEEIIAKIIKNETGKSFIFQDVDEFKTLDDGEIINVINNYVMLPSENYSELFNGEVCEAFKVNKVIAPYMEELNVTDAPNFIYA